MWYIHVLHEYCDPKPTFNPFLSFSTDCLTFGVGVVAVLLREVVHRCWPLPVVRAGCPDPAGCRVVLQAQYLQRHSVAAQTFLSKQITYSHLFQEHFSGL